MTYTQLQFQYLSCFCNDRSLTSINWGPSTSIDLQRTTHEMPTSPNPSTPKPSFPLVKPPKICPFLPLPSATLPFPSLALPPPCSYVETPSPYFNTAGTHNSSVSPFTTPTHSSLFASSPPSYSLPSPRANVTLTGHCAHTSDRLKNGTLIGGSHRKLNCIPEISPAKMLPPSIHHELQSPSPTQNTTILALPLSCIPTYCLPCNSHTSHVQDFSAPTFTNINGIPPSSLASFPENIPEFYLPPALSEWWERKTAPQLLRIVSNR